MTAVVIAGAIDIGFAVFHMLFWRLFQWPKRLPASGTVNAAITQTLNCMLIYVFFAYGSGLIWLALGDGRGAALLAWAGAGFWVLRAVLQAVLFPMGHWMSITITVVFVITAGLHVWAALA